MADLSDLITVLACTSPTASDPSLAAIVQTMESVAAFDEIGYAPLLIGADGIRPEQRHLTDQYEEKVAVLGLSTVAARDCGVFRLPRWGHQANVMRMLLEHVTTPLVLFMEHDTPLLPAETCPIDWQGCAQTLLDGELDLLRFHHESHILPEHEHLMIGDEGDGASRRIPYLRTVQWSQRPHLARTDWYRELINTYFAPSSRCFVEDVMHSVVVNTWNALGLEGWNRFRMALYADPEPTMQRSFHLDARAGSEKYEQVFAFPDMGWPEFAPCPSLQKVFE